MVILEKITVSLAEIPIFQRGVRIRFRGGMVGIKNFKLNTKRKWHEQITNYQLHKEDCSINELVI